MPGQTQYPTPPSHLRFSQRVEKLRYSRDRNARQLYLAVLVYSLEAEVHDDWPELAQTYDVWIDFSTGSGRIASIRVRAVGLLKLVREAKWA